eukprot:m.25812 g.25812  ORF g.25812 m.25812 type:complete len:76 (-) comp8010_c0_seq1:297-524(-)
MDAAQKREQEHLRKVKELELLCGAELPSLKPGKRAYECRGSGRVFFRANVQELESRKRAELAAVKQHNLRAEDQR